MNSKIIINIETNEWFIQLLNEYQRIILSCIGPVNGCLKLVSKSNDYNDLKLTSCSFNLFSILYDLKNSTNNEKEKWQFDLIKTIVTNCHFEHYYDSGLFLCHLINEFLILESGHYNCNKKFIDSILNELIEHLKTDSLIRCKLDLNNIQFMRTFTSTCLKSKYIINQDDLNETFINLCLKAYIKSFQDNTDTFTNLIYLFNENNSFSLSDSQLFNGILFQTSDTLQQHITSSNNKLKCVLFDSSFSGDFGQINEQDFQIEINSNQFQNNRNVFLMMNKFIELVDYLINTYKINVFLCQKVIHPSLKVYLSKKNVIYVDRLSILITKPMSSLTGCKIVNCSWSLEQFNENTFGYLSSIQLKQILNKNYIHFENENESTLQTMIVCVQNESLTYDLEYLLKVVEFNFQRTVRAGFGLCGGACFYTYCICFLWKYITSNTSPVKQMDLFNLKKIIKIVFFKYAKNLLDKSKEYRLDLKSGHLFNNDLKCNCGLYKLNNLKFDYNSLLDLDDDINFVSINFSNLLTTNTDLSRTESDIKLIDSLDSKINVFKLAREILASILQIGVFIHN